jgi:hypothetical protein
VKFLRYAALVVLAFAFLPTSPARAAGPAYVSIVAGRSFFQGADLACNPYPGSVDLLTVAQRLHDRTRPISVYGEIQGDFIKSGTRYCPGRRGYHDIYPTWQDLATLRDSYGWSFGSNGRDLNYMTRGNRTPAQLWNTSCGALRDLRAHGHTRGWSLFAYPGGGDPDDVSDAVQHDYVSQCFGFGRKYDNTAPYETNQRSDEGSKSANPLGWQWTHNIYGGLCNLAGDPCASQTVSPMWHYENPAAFAALLSPAADSWSVLQFHVFVEGSRLSGADDHWDCTSADWRAHWSSRPELYCWSDFVKALDSIPATVTVADPATVATAWGRTLPAPRVTRASPTAGGAGTQVVLSTANVRAVGSPSNAFISGNGLTVKFGATKATVVSASATSVTVKVPSLAASGPTPITLVNADGTSTKATGLFTYR